MDFSVMFFASLATGSTRDHYRLLLDAARLADAEGFAGIWTPERHFDQFGGVFPNPAVTNAALATVTERIQLRAGSVISPLHDPLLIAEDWAVIDNLSNGRAAVSFGSGWNPDDFVLNPAAYAERRALMWEQVELIDHLWAGGSIERRNGVDQIVEIALSPRPVQATLPRWITTGGTPETFTAAGRSGAHLLTHLITQDLDALAERIALYRKGRADAGLDPATGCVTLMVHAFVGEDHEHARSVAEPPLRTYLRSAMQLDMKATRARVNGESDGYDDDLLDELLAVRLARYFDGLSLLGDVDACVAVVETMAAIGVDDLACLVDFGIANDDVLAGLARLAEVMGRCALAHPLAPATPVAPDASLTPSEPARNRS